MPKTLGEYKFSVSDVVETDTSQIYLALFSLIRERERKGKENRVNK